MSEKYFALTHVAHVEMLKNFPVTRVQILAFKKLAIPLLPRPPPQKKAACVTLLSNIFFIYILLENYISIREVTGTISVFLPL